MERIFLSIVLLSAASGILGLILTVFFYVSQKQYRARSKCYIWISLLLSMLLPVSLNFEKSFTGVLSSGAVSGQNQFTLLPTEMTEPGGISIPEKDWFTILTWIWLAGVGLVLLTKLICYADFKRKLRKNSEILQENPANQAVQKLSRMLGIQKEIRLYGTTEIDTPLLMGIFRPAIYLPENSWTGEQQELILLHELSHYKNHDLVVRCLMMLVTAVHWFNPVAYLISRELKVSMEEACDAMVLRQCSLETRRLYGKTVLETAYRQSTGVPLVSATFATRHSRLKERCQRILSGDGNLCRGKGLTIGVCSLVAALVVACALIPKPPVSANDQNTSLPASQSEPNLPAIFDMADNWLFPLEGNLNVTAPYGEGAYTFHKGLDVSRDGITGEEIHAAKAGVVVTANTASNAYGNYIVIDHGNGYQTTYAHCQSLAVAEGQQVAQGETIAFVGSTGNSTGPHLHFEVQMDGQLLDPAELFPDLKNLQ